MPPQAHIVICDDDHQVRFGTARMLRKAGYDVSEAENGKQCLELVRKERPDLVLVDWVMPGIEGPEVCRELKADPELVGLVVVMLSGSKTSEEDQADGLEIGADAYMMHPLHARMFLAHISALLRMRAAEQRLRESQRLAAVGTLACGVAHEINNPLMGIINYAQLLHDRCGGDNKTMRDFTNEIISAGNRVANIVRGLMGFAGAYAADSPAEPLQELINSVLQLCEVGIRSEGICVEVEVSAGLPRLARGTGGVRHILFSLIKNARESLKGTGKTAPGGATIRIVAKESATAGAVRVSVEDNGPGVAREHRERVFEPFFTTKNRALHTGLDLTVAREMARELGGDLTLASPIGSWTCFSLDLPGADHDES